MSGKTMAIVAVLLAIGGVGFWYWKKHKRAAHLGLPGVRPMGPGGGIQQAAAAKSKAKKGWRSRLGGMAKSAVKAAAVSSGIPGAQQALYVAGV